MQLKKISTKPFLFGIEKQVVKDEDYFYNNTYFFVVNRNTGNMQKYPLSNITEISKTFTKINNRRIWQIKLIDKEQELTFKFAHNFTLWNQNFPKFLNKMKQLNLSVVKTSWSVWSM